MTNELIETGEIWKDVKDFVGLYQISNYGQVKSLNRIVEYKNGKIYCYKTKILKQSIDSYGYAVVGLTKQKNIKTKKVHRLILEAFVPISEEKLQVNHIDENKLNNTLENLEWCTTKYNTNHGTSIVRRSKKCNKAVIGERKNKKIRFESLREASLYVNTPISGISLALSGKRKTAGGYTWNYQKEGN